LPTLAQLGDTQAWAFISHTLVGADLRLLARRLA